MQMSGNTILITGGGSGIGRGLAEAFFARGNKVIIAGRRQSALDEVTALHRGMEAIAFDTADAGAIGPFADEVSRRFPDLDAVIHNAGIMRTEVVRDGQTADAEAMVTTNLLGPIWLTAALLPLLLRQPRATIMTVTSGLAYVPLSLNPTYCATKAAIHSYTQSLRYQLRDSAVQVIELVPPYVRTGLTGERQANDPSAMPLDEFIAEVMQLLETNPDAPEVCVARVVPLRTAESRGEYDAFYKRFNDAMIAART